MCSSTPGLFQRLIDRSRSESTKRATAIWATWTLAICALGIGGSVAYRVVTSGDVGSGTVAAFAAVTVPLAGLAGFNYRKADNPMPEAK